MLRTRSDFYQPGLPARPGEHYGALVRFARKHAGHTILDVGCGFGAYSVALMAGGWLTLVRRGSAPERVSPVAQLTWLP